MRFQKLYHSFYQKLYLFFVFRIRKLYRSFYQKLYFLFCFQDSKALSKLLSKALFIFCCSGFESFIKAFIKSFIYFLFSGWAASAWERETRLKSFSGLVKKIMKYQERKKWSKIQISGWPNCSLLAQVCQASRVPEGGSEVGLQGRTDEGCGKC